MSEQAHVTVWINGAACTVRAGSVVSAAMLTAGAVSRASVSGEPRTALCGMGICFECRAIVDGVSHQRTCQLLCREGMRVETQR
ncbi:MAG: (2Fe-2S)-binding protein [Acidobacteriaceae bacterium]